MADLRRLHPLLVPYARELYRIGKYNDPLLVVTSGYRSMRKQAELFDKWRTGQSAIPANRPGGSLHQYGLAFDMARIGKDPFTDPLLTWLGAVWESWGGRYGGAGDPVHFQPRI